jgi:hypothetical protein
MAAFGADAVDPPAFTFPGSASAAFNPADLGGLGTSSYYGSVAAVLNPAASNRVGSTAAAVAAPVDLSIGVCASRKRKRDENGFKTHIGMHAPAYGDEPYYRPEKFVPEDDVFNLDQLKEHQHHWNFKMQGTGKGKEVRLWCGDVAPTVPGLQSRKAADSDIPSGFSQCCWEARIAPNDVGSGYRLYLPYYGANNKTFHEFAKSLLDATEVSAGVIRLSTRDALVTDDGHIIPLDVNLRKMPPIMKQEIRHRLVDGQSLVDAKCPISSDPRFKGFEPFIQDGFISARDLLTKDNKGSEPGLQDEHMRLVSAALKEHNAGVEFNKVPTAPGHAMIVTDWMGNEL